MKSIFTLCIALCTIINGFAQTDTTSNPNSEGDTIRIGGMVIIRKAGSKTETTERDREYHVKGRHSNKQSNISTNWWILDLGFSNYVDNTIYNSPAAQAYAPSTNSTWFQLKDGKSRNVNVWFFMQKLNMAKHVLNLKYGLGLELNNYHY